MLLGPLECDERSDTGEDCLIVLQIRLLEAAKRDPTGIGIGGHECLDFFDRDSRCQFARKFVDSRRDAGKAMCSSSCSASVGCFAVRRGDLPTSESPHWTRRRRFWVEIR